MITVAVCFFTAGMISAPGPDMFAVVGLRSEFGKTEGVEGAVFCNRSYNLSTIRVES